MNNPLRHNFLFHLPRRNAFTMIELLIAVGVVIILLSILIIAVNAGAKLSQKANTQVLMNTINQALVQFREDVGYLPPVLDRERNLLDPPDITNAVSYISDVQDWYSETSLAEYLIGTGSHIEDGYGRVPGAALLQDWDLESPALGIRHPGRDGVWGATINGTGELLDRMKQGTSYGSETAPFEFDQGKVFGPYLELKDDRLLAGIRPNGQIVFAGEAPDYNELPKVIVDYWGKPIRYYRRWYNKGSLETEVRATDRDGDGLIDPLPTLSEYHVLRPFRAEESTIVQNAKNFRGRDFDLTTHNLQSAQFGLLSLGPDRGIDITERADIGDGDGDGVAEENADNITEAGQ